MNAPPSTSATAAKDRLYAQLAGSLGRLNRSITITADLCEELEVDLQAMRTFAGLDAAKFMAIASIINGHDEEEDGEAGDENRAASTAKS